MKSPLLPEFWVSKARLETLMDGVFAIAMTLMVLEIRIPELIDRGSLEEFTAAMKHNLPGIFAFLLSMGMLGLFWYRHHRQYHFIARITPGLLAINLAFLGAVAFFPFSAGVLGKYPVNFGVYFIYLPNIFLMVFLLFAQWIHAKHFGLLGTDITPDGARLIHLENILGLGIVTIVTMLYLGMILMIRHYHMGRSALSYVVWIIFPMMIMTKIMRRRLGLA